MIENIGMARVFSAMSKESKDFRKQAAGHLRNSRKEASGPAREREKVLAAGYKELAHNEERVSGDRQRSRKRPVKPEKK